MLSNRSTKRSIPTPLPVGASTETTLRPRARSSPALPLLPSQAESEAQEDEVQEDEVQEDEVQDEAQEDPLRLREVPGPYSRRRRYLQRQREQALEERQLRQLEQLRTERAETVQNLASVAQARAQAEKERLENERALLQQARGDAEAQFALKRKILDAQNNAAEIERLVETVKRASAIEDRLARARADQRLAKLAEEAKEKERLILVSKQNHMFLETEGVWMGQVAGLLGMDGIEALTHVDDKGVYEPTKHLESAKQAALNLVHRYICSKIATWESLKSQHTFLHLIATYYIQFTENSDKRWGGRSRSSSFAAERHIYELLRTTYKLKPDDIAEKLLGDLNQCQ